MNSALVFLLTRSTWNAVLARLRRLKNPKYLLGTIVGGFYFYSVFYRQAFASRATRALGGRSSAADWNLPPELVLDLASLLLLLVVLFGAWIFPASRAALAFTEAEMAFLLPGPVSRSTLIRFKLLKSQLGLLFLALLFGFLRGRMLHDGSAAWIHVLGWWLLLSLLQMHRLGASFALTRLYERGLSTTKRRLLGLAVVAVILAGLAAWHAALPPAPELRALTTAGVLFRYLGEFVQSGPAPWLLWPFKLMLRPSFALDALGFAAAVGPALLVLAAHYFWVTRSDVAFEEASIALSQRRAALQQAVREGRKRIKPPATDAREPLFALAPMGWVPLAFVWKHFLQMGGRRALRRTAWIVLAVLGIATALTHSRYASVASPILSTIGTMGLWVSLIIFAALAAQSVQREMGAAEVIKTYPVPGFQFVLGHLLGPALHATALQWVALSLCVSDVGRILANYKMGGLAAIFVGALFLPALNLLLSLVPTAAPLLFPGWFRPGEGASFEATGLRVVSFFGQLLFVLLALFPVVLAASAVGFVAYTFTGISLAAISSISIAGIMVTVEAWVGVQLLGKIVDRYDPTEV